MLARIHPDPRRSVRSRSWLLAGPLAATLTLMTTTLVSAQGFWATLPSMPTIREGLAAAAAPCPPGLKGTCVYALGGFNDKSSILDTVEAYSPAMNSWSPLPPMPTHRYGLAATAAPCPSGLTGTCLYAFGGLDNGTGSLNTAEVYSSATNGWPALPSMPTARHFLAAASAPCPSSLTGTCVYALGGADDTLTSQNTLTVYSPVTNAWTTLAPMLTARYLLAAAAAPCPSGLKGTCVYALGGNDTVSQVKTVEANNPATNAWTSLPSMPTSRDGLGAAAGPCPRGARGSCVYAVGGGNSTNGVLNTVETFSTLAGVWTILPSMPAARTQLAGAAAPCPTGARGACVYALGGKDFATAPLNTAEALVR